MLERRIEKARQAGLMVQSVGRSGKRIRTVSTECRGAVHHRRSFEVMAFLSVYKSHTGELVADTATRCWMHTTTSSASLFLSVWTQPAQLADAGNCPFCCKCFFISISSLADHVIHFAQQTFCVEGLPRAYISNGVREERQTRKGNHRAAVPLP